MNRITTKDCVPDYSLPGVDSVDGIAAYIVECKVYGIGKTLAHKIAQRYGRFTFDQLCGPDYKHIAYDIDGIGDLKAYALHTAFMKKFGPQVEEARRKREEQRRAAAIFWGELKVSPRMRERIENWFGENAADVLKDNPYRLTEIDGFGFRRADEVAERFGITGDDPRRIKAGIHYVLDEIAPTEGHCCLPKDTLIVKASYKNVLDVDSKLVADAITQEISDGNLILDGNVYSQKMYEAEQAVAIHLHLLNEPTYWYSESNVIEDKFSTIQYNELQRKAIATAMSQRLMILTGGPGTGKTTTLMGMLRMFEKDGLRCVLCAPTGRAAKRMTEATGRTAKTIHRLLEYKNGEFTRNVSNPISEEVIICDESSMIDILLMRSLLRAAMECRHLILIGDNDQLPSVGAGRVLGDMIDSGCIPTVRLTEIYRQQEGSYIISNAHNIIHGKEPVVNGTTDFFFLPATSEDEAQDIVCNLVSERLPKAYPGDETQVLCPMRKDGVKTGCNELNRRLQQALNPYGQLMPIGDRSIRDGDRVMQMKNNYALDVFNGDVGICEGIGIRERKDFDGYRYVKNDETVLKVRYPDRQDCVGYNDEAVHDLDLCYATTIHKSQGSEYDTVVIVLMPSAFFMLQRNLLYTAVTRAKKRCFIVGDWKCVRAAVSQWKTKPRHTGLSRRI